MQKLILIRGLPGSGKSTLAQTFDAVHLEADQYFINRQGEYHYDPQLLKKAHLWCRQQTEFYLSKGEDVVVANTFVRHWEMADYKKLAKKYQAALQILVCENQFPNVHGVSAETIKTMKKRWQN